MRIMKFALIIPTLLLIGCGSGTTVIAVDSNTGAPPSKDGQGAVIVTSTGSRLRDGSANGFDASSHVVQISQVLSDGSTGLCSGVVIAPGAVLTAAHCFSSEATSATILANGVDYPVNEVILHPEFSLNSKTAALSNDVAIVKSKDLSIPALPILASLPVVDGETFSLNDSGTRLYTEDAGSPAVFSFTDVAGNFELGIIGILSSGNEQDELALLTNVQNNSMIEFIATAAPGVVFN